MSQSYQTNISQIQTSTFLPVKGGKAGKKETLTSAKRDTIATCESAFCARVETIIPYTKPILEKGKKGNDQKGYLAELTSAFAAVFEQFAKGVQSQVTIQSSLQTLDQTMSQTVILSANKQIAEEEQEMYLRNEAQKKEKEANKISGILQDITSLGIAPLLRHFNVSKKTIGEVTGAMGVGLMIGGIAIGIATGGLLGVAEEAAEGAVVAAEEEASSVASQAATTLEETSSSGASTTETSASSVGETGLSSSSAAEGEDLGDVEMEEITTTQNQDEQATDSQQVENENIQSKSEYTKKLQKLLKEKVTWENAGKIAKGAGKRLFSVVLTAFFNSNQGVECYASSYIAKYKSDLAKVQKAIGEQRASTENSNLIFAFYQHILQQSADIIQEFGSQLGNVINTYSSINHAYRDIGTGLAQAV